MKYDNQKIKKILKKMFPDIFMVLTRWDKDAHLVDCAELAENPKELTAMLKRFKRTFDDGCFHSW